MSLMRQREIERRNKQNSGRSRQNRDEVANIRRTVADRAPTTADNFTAGHGYFSEWIDTTANQLYRAVGDGVWV